MNRLKSPLLLVLVVSALLIGVLVCLHFCLPEKTPNSTPTSSSSTSLPAPWENGDVSTRIA